MFTKGEALDFYNKKRWEPMSHRERAEFQIEQDLLCMPFSVFHEAMEKALGRPVYTHEFGLDRDGLRAELAGNREAPTLDEIVSQLPAEKLIVVDVASPDRRK